jgi:glycosyltransferase involved in cell wall biosynthesis
MHAGSLHYNTGIEELIEAFEQMSNKTEELWFFGSGAMDKYIKDKASENKRIRHMGFVDPEKLFEYEKRASLLVNVRDPKAEYTKYSFPSKTFEYMASGTPFLTTELPGIPPEYKEYIFTIESNNVENVKEGLEKALALTEQERVRFGNRARAFILKNKNKDIQAKKMADFLGCME